jgi:hypothetical protein
MTAADDEELAYRQWQRKLRRRMLRNLWRTLERNMASMAARARRRHRNRRRQPRHPQGPPPEDFNPVAQVRREIMPLVAQLAQLAAGGPIELGKRPAPNPRRRRKR